MRYLAETANKPIGVGNLLKVAATEKQISKAR
jgi:hypothetical protein